MLGRHALSTLAICALTNVSTGQDGIVLRAIDSSGAAYATFDHSDGIGALVGTTEGMEWNVPSAPTYRVRDDSGPSTSTGGGS